VRWSWWGPDLDQHRFGVLSFRHGAIRGSSQHLACLDPLQRKLVTGNGIVQRWQPTSRTCPDLLNRGRRRLVLCWGRGTPRFILADRACVVVSCLQSNLHDSLAAFSGGASPTILRLRLQRHGRECLTRLHIPFHHTNLWLAFARNVERSDSHPVTVTLRILDNAEYYSVKRASTPIQ